MKKLIVIVLALTLTLSCCLLFGCSNDVEITFVQDGQEDIVMTVEKGESLIEIPAPASKDGYTAKWSLDDFSGLKKDVTVEAIYTANEYVITYEINKDHASISTEKQTVKFDSEFTLVKPTTTLTDYDFSHWQIKETSEKFTDESVYSIPKDITLVAVWAPVGGSEWSPNG